MSAHWSRKIETGKVVEGRWRKQEKQIKVETRQIHASLSAPVEDSIKKRVKKF